MSAENASSAVVRTSEDVDGVAAGENGALALYRAAGEKDDVESVYQNVVYHVDHELYTGLARVPGSQDGRDALDVFGSVELISLSTGERVAYFEPSPDLDMSCLTEVEVVDRIPADEIALDVVDEDSEEEN